MAKGFEGKGVLVTGSGTGIGREIALAFARAGADVVLHYAHSAAGAVSAAREIESLGRRATAFQANFEQAEEVIRLGDQAIDFLGRVHVLINNSGITMNKPFLKVTLQQYETIFDVNMRAQFFLAQHVVRHMLENGGGAVINLSSVHGFSGAPEHSVYAATKGAIIAFTRELGIELAHKGVRVNAIAPGWVMVDNHARAQEGYTEEGARAAARDKVPLGRPGLPEEIASLAVFLASEDAAFIVGQTIIADGGTTSLMSLISDFRHESSARFGTGYVAGI